MMNNQVMLSALIGMGKSENLSSNDKLKTILLAGMGNPTLNGYMQGKLTKTEHQLQEAREEITHVSNEATAYRSVVTELTGTDDLEVIKEKFEALPARTRKELQAHFKIAEEPCVETKT